MFDLIVVGAGASGVFTAIEAKRRAPKKRVAVFERTNSFLSKVKISGGGRCNVTHRFSDRVNFCASYPRGQKELLGSFTRFSPEDTISWFCERNVELKCEKDGRMFPVSNSSETIIKALMNEMDRLGVELYLQKKVDRIEKGFRLYCGDELVQTKRLVLATGSNKRGYGYAKCLGHSIQTPIASLFTFNVPTSRLKHLSGVSVANATVSLEGFKRSETGPVLITHFGFSGPAIIKLSAFCAQYLYEKDYKAQLNINWTDALSEQETYERLKDKSLVLPKSLLKEFFIQEGQQRVVKQNKKLGQKDLGQQKGQAVQATRQTDQAGHKDQVGQRDLRAIAKRIVKDTYNVEGKTTNKEEFVTCGGVKRKEINFRTMESTVCPNLFIVGELADIDGITGGFNFQNAWTSGYIAAKSVWQEKG